MKPSSVLKRVNPIHYYWLYATFDFTHGLIYYRARLLFSILSSLLSISYDLHAHAHLHAHLNRMVDPFMRIGTTETMCTTHLLGWPKCTIWIYIERTAHVVQAWRQSGIIFFSNIDFQWCTCWVTISGWRIRWIFFTALNWVAIA